MVVTELATAFASRRPQLHRIDNHDLAAPIVDDAFFLQVLRNQGYGGTAYAEQRGDLLLSGSYCRRFHSLMARKKPAANALRGGVDGGARNKLLRLQEHPLAAQGHQTRDFLINRCSGQ